MRGREEVVWIFLNNSTWFEGLTELDGLYSVDEPSMLVTVTAREGAVGDWSAYVHRRGTVLESGVKIPQPEAERLFPRWAERLAYRK